MTKGGSRPKRRPSDRRGGARPGSGPTIRRLVLDADTAAALKVLTLVRRGITGNAALRPVDVATELIRAAWREYTASVEEAESEWADRLDEAEAALSDALGEIEELQALSASLRRVAARPGHRLEYDPVEGWIVVLPNDREYYTIEDARRLLNG
jgi:hypothetical protein